eukprot:scaffold1996_cov132-Isochrysis_galbana.AAC.17
MGKGRGSVRTARDRVLVARHKQRCERGGAAWVPGLRRLRPPPSAAGSVERAGQAPERQDGHA